MNSFVHLHLHTEYSLLDGATRISSIADKAIEYGQPAVAITDHGVMYGAVEFYKALKSKGVKPIIGCEVYVAPRSRFSKEGKQDSSNNHLVLLCKNEIGYRNLCYMVSESFINGFYSRPRIDMDLLRTHHEGLIALSGCLAGKVARLILAGALAEAENYALELKELFGDDFYLEIQNHNLADDLRVSYAIKLISEKHGIPMVATNDVHYLDKSDADLQATLMCVATNNVITEGRPFGFETDEFYFKSTEEMTELFANFEGAIENTVKIAGKCNFDFEFDKLHLPTFVPEDGLSHKDKLRKDAYLGFERHIANGRFDFDKNARHIYEERIEYELEVIDKMGFNAYFLIVADFVSYAKSVDIPVGPGRGSGAGSLVAFCVGITDVDPIAFDLLFERFLNPERVSMPDFDIDFCYDRRGEVIEYVKRKYGEDKVAQIVTFGTLAPRAAVRDVGRALGIPLHTVDSVAKLISHDSSDLDDALKNKELYKMYVSDADIRNLIDVSRRVLGMPRHASTHAAGVVMTEKPTYEYVPLSYTNTSIVTQYDMITDAEIGLVKFDFLGLRYITVIHDAEKLIRKRIPDFDISKVPFDDNKTFALLCEARSDAVFQLESGGMKSVLSRLRPSCLEDIIACVALYRPGPMDSINTFIARKHGKEEVTYLTEELKDILDVTYGCIVYQEQVMQICRKLAGYSYAHADIVRRAMSKKKESAMLKEREAFISGCISHDVDKNAAESIFDEMVGFAKYAFNKSHATAYAIISYRTAYLKAHYPAEYFAAMMSSELGKNNSHIKAYIADAQKHRVHVLPPDINKSDGDFTVADGDIRFGLLAIRNVGYQFADAVIRERRNGDYKSLDDFIERLSGSELNKRTLESLIKCGVFDGLGTPRSALLASYETLIDAEHHRSRNNIGGQIDIFSSTTDSGDRISTGGFTYPDIPEMPLREKLVLEKENSGIYFSGHLIDNYSDALSNISYDRINDILDAFDEEIPTSDTRFKDRSAVTISGIISEKRTKETRNGDTMAFIKLEDRYGEIEVIIFAKHYKNISHEVFVDNAVLIAGNISAEDGESVKILLSDLKPLSPNGEVSVAEKGKKMQPDEKPTKVWIKIPSPTPRHEEILRRLAHFNPGDCQVFVRDSDAGKSYVLKSVKVADSDKVRERLSEVFGDENVVFL